MTLSELLAGHKIVLAKAQVVQLERLAQELLRWNQRHNLTAITAIDQVYEKHLIP
jgi:16S rRNA (guanine527-N7)-methyltransferase